MQLNIFLGLEVVFQCRDEGVLRLPVRWSRPGGRQLPPGSKDVAGRLEIPNIRVSKEKQVEFLVFPRNSSQLLNFY